MIESGANNIAIRYVTIKSTEPEGFKCWIVLLLYSAVCTVASLSLFYLLLYLDLYVIGNDTPVNK